MILITIIIITIIITIIIIIIIIIIIATMIMMIKTVIIAIVIINTPFQPGDFSTGSTTEMYSFLTIFKVSVKCFRLPILMIAS